MPIAPEQLQTARELFEAASAEQGGAREALLLRGAQGDAELRALVDRMLLADSSDQPLLDSPLSIAASDLGGGLLEPGSQVGRYRIVREIGSGGMGSVYLAELTDGPAQQFFAIKIVRWLSADISKRFRHETSILNSLQHPNIARLLDSGMTDWRSPWFAMEYVEGLPIHQWCEARSLSIDGKLLLFRQLCAAVQYLHRNLVVHRDLKPGNVLVTADGIVKLVDFGIARLLQPDDFDQTSPPTVTGAMTPDYASPEQLRGAPASTLTDVYSLGILLHELLTGSRAVGGEVRSSLRGEAATIVLKAIRQEPERRYISVEQFDEDIRRHLEGLPVIAQGDSLVYRARKFTGRNQAGVAAAAAIVLILCAGIVSTLKEAEIARRERTRAEDQAQVARQQARIAQRREGEAQAERANALRERGNAERRLAELQKLAEGAVGVYTSGDVEASSKAADPAALIAQNARDSLLALQRESVLNPAMAGLLDTTSAEAHSYQLATDAKWVLPAGWEAFSAAPHEYRVGIDHELAHTGKSSLFIRSLTAKPKGSTVVVQRLDAGPWQGKRVRLSGYLRAGKLSNDSGLWLQVLTEHADAGNADAFLSGTSGWIRREIVIDVPANADSILFGVRMTGAGTLWADDFSFERVPTSVPVTIRRGPANLTFTK